jgi:hemolysin activation/secretion protein
MLAYLIYARSRCARGEWFSARSGLTLFAVCLLGMLFICPQPLRAQGRPDAGQILEGIRPPPPASAPNPDAALPPQEERPAISGPASELVLVKHWRITGAHAFKPEQLEALIHEYRGQKLTLTELNAVARRITAHYRQHGYMLSRAYVPAQKIRDNTVEIAVLEGHLSSIDVTNSSPVAGSLVTKHLEHLRRTGPVEGRNLSRSLLLLNDLPGVEVRSTLKPGAAVGTSDLDIQVNSTHRFSGSVDADSYGNRFTGQFRGGGTLNFNEPLHYGDVLSLRADSAGHGMNYGRLGYQVPLGGNGLKIGLAASDLKYRLGKEFASLSAHGTAEVGTLWTAYQLVRTPYHNLAFQLTYDHKRLDDRIDANFTDIRKTLDVATFGISGDWSDDVVGNAINVYSVDFISGRLRLDPLTAAFDQGPGGHQTQGRYTKLALNYSRTQTLTRGVSLYMGLAAQTTNKNLDTSETQAIGGAYGVRAYPQDEGAGDDAAVLNIELRWSVPEIPELEILTFADGGMVKMHHQPLPADTNNRRNLAGEGLGLQWIDPKRFALKTYLAWRAGPAPLTDSDRRPRIWLQFAQYF